MSILQKKLVLFFSTIFLLSTQFLFAQKKLKSGVIVFEITKVETNIPELKLMKGTETKLYFTPEKQKIDVDLNNETVKIQTIYNSRSEETLVLYDIIGLQFKVRSNNRTKPRTKPFIKNIDYQKLTTKTIAGHQCYKAEISFEDETITVWLTDRIKMKNPDFQSLFPGLQDFPLEYVRRGENSKMTFKAISVNELLSEDVFKASEAYQEISEKDFKERMGGMKFGF